MEGSVAQEVVQVIGDLDEPDEQGREREEHEGQEQDGDDGDDGFQSFHNEEGCSFALGWLDEGGRPAPDGTVQSDGWR